MYKPKKKKPDTTMQLGQDSFLDLVSNIVGILIILVMIAGVRASTSQKQDDAKQIEEMNRQTAEVSQLQGSIAELKEQEMLIGAQLASQGVLYNDLFDKLTTARAALDVAAEKKGSDAQERIENQRQANEIAAKIQEAKRAKQYLEQIHPQATIVENQPTPLAKQVEEKEIHYRLLGKKIAYVPWLELMEQIRTNVAQNKERYFGQQISSGKVGPIEHFTLEFMLETLNVPFEKGGGRMLSLQLAQMQPDESDFGEPVHTALQLPMSLFFQQLSRFRKDIYTVTLWVYPDSFEEYQVVKQYLYVHGYKVAARPMDFGETISGSPRGSKSAAQ